MLGVSVCVWLASLSISIRCPSLVNESHVLSYNFKINAIELPQFNYQSNNIHNNNNKKKKKKKKNNVLDHSERESLLYVNSESVCTSGHYNLQIGLDIFKHYCSYKSDSSSESAVGSSSSNVFSSYDSYNSYYESVGKYSSSSAGHYYIKYLYNQYIEIGTPNCIYYIISHHNFLDFNIQIVYLHNKLLDKYNNKNNHDKSNNNNNNESHNNHGLLLHDVHNNQTTIKINNIVTINN